MTDGDELLSVTEFAKRCGGLSPWTIYAWLSQGRLIRTKVGARTFVRAKELAKVIRDEEPRQPAAAV